MRVQVLSDLHQEFGLSEISFSQADVVVFAGDTNVGIKGVEWIKTRITSVPVIYILGNHEYYKGSFPKSLHKIKAVAQGTNIHLLENKAIEIDGVTFHGCTLWTNFELFGNPRVNGSICQEKMNDYRQIRKDPTYSRLRSIDTYNIHQASVRWLKESLEKSTTQKNIVVTHHAPSIKSIPEEQREDILSSAYASNLEQMIFQFRPNYWIHGHIHRTSKYMIRDTAVICNPHGYIHEKNDDFDPETLVDI